MEKYCQINGFVHVTDIGKKTSKNMCKQMQKTCLQVWMQYCVFDLALLSTRYVRSPAIVRDSRNNIGMQVVKLVF